MNVLIYTNVILDVLLHREPFHVDAARIITLSENDKINGFVSASAITDIFYIARKALQSKIEATELLKNLLKIINVASVSGNDIM